GHRPDGRHNRCRSDARWYTGCGRRFTRGARRLPSESCASRGNPASRHCLPMCWFRSTLPPITRTWLPRCCCPSPCLTTTLRARAQAGWAAQSLQERCALVHRLRETIYARRQEIAERVMRESGKPRVEALFADVLVSLDTAAYYANLAPALLLPESVPHHNAA